MPGLRLPALRIALRRTLVALGLLSVLGATLGGHGGMSAVTWNREVSRIVYARCASCHRPGGSAFSLMTYADAQPHGNAIKDAVLARRMPPWGAVKGFGQFRNDQSLMQEQIEVIQRWVDGGLRRGNNPRMLPSAPTFAANPVTPAAPFGQLRVSGVFTLRASAHLDGLLPERVPATRSLRIVAERPDGVVVPLVWLHEYDGRFSHPFFFRQPLSLPAGTVIRGVPSDAVVTLLQTPPS
jgi:hypothetical protein